MGNKSHFVFILKEISFFENPQNSGQWRGNDWLSALPMTTILKIFKERYLLQDEDKMELFTHQFLQKNPENRFLKFPALRFPLVSELFDEGKKSPMLFSIRATNFGPGRFAEIGGNRPQIRNDFVSTHPKLKL